MAIPDKPPTSGETSKPVISKEWMAFFFRENQILSHDFPPKNLHENGKTIIWSCIPY